MILNANDIKISDENITQLNYVFSMLRSFDGGRATGLTYARNFTWKIFKKQLIFDIVFSEQKMKHLPLEKHWTVQSTSFHQ